MKPRLKNGHKRRCREQLLKGADGGYIRRIMHRCERNSSLQRGYHGIGNPRRPPVAPRENSLESDTRQLRQIRETPDLSIRDQVHSMRDGGNMCRCIYLAFTGRFPGCSVREGRRRVPDPLHAPFDQGRCRLHINDLVFERGTPYVRTEYTHNLFPVLFSVKRRSVRNPRLHCYSGFGSVGSSKRGRSPKSGTSGGFSSICWRSSSIARSNCGSPAAA